MNQILWRDIQGYEGFYQISNIGIVRSLDRKIQVKKGYSKLKGRNLKPRLNRYGYLIVNLSKDGKERTFSIHRLGALAFLKNTYNKRCINHKNGIKTDNNIINLEWVTHLENNVHAIKFGLKKYKNIIDQCSGKTYNSISQAAKHTGISYSKLKRIFCLGQANNTCLQLVA